jgi:hypothetical protein
LGGVLFPSRRKEERGNQSGCCPAALLPRLFDPNEVRRARREGEAIHVVCAAIIKSTQRPFDAQTQAKDSLRGSKPERKGKEKAKRRHSYVFAIRENVRPFAVGPSVRLSLRN